MKKLLFVISSLDTGGAQRALSNLVINLPDSFEIDILLNSSEHIIYPYRGNIIDLGIKIPQNRKNVFYLLKVLWKRCRKLRTLKKNSLYTACISFLESANIANILTGRKHCKVYLSVRSYLSHDESGVTVRILKAVMRLLYNRADKVLPVSEGIRLDLVKNFGIRPDKTLTIYNGFDINFIRDKAKGENNSPYFTFISMGRLTPQKGQWHLIRAFHTLVRKGLECKLVILGDGSYKEYLETLVDGYGLKDSVELKGFIENPYIELASADAFVFPSLWEGLPNAVLEAMACGLPVICSDCRSGAREILAPDTDIEYEQTNSIEMAKYGIITPVCSGIKYNADEQLEKQELLLAEAMEMLYTDSRLAQKYAELSRERANDFSIEKAVEQWIDAVAGVDRYA